MNGKQYCFYLREGERMVRCAAELVEMLRRESPPVTLRITEDLPTGELRFVATRHDCPTLSTVSVGGDR